MKAPKVKLSDFGFGYQYPSHFVSSQWQKNKDEVSVFFFIYRTLMFLFVFCNYTSNLALDNDPGYFLIYLTNQGITIVLLDQLLAFILVLWYYVKQVREPSAPLV